MKPKTIYIYGKHWNDDVSIWVLSKYVKKLKVSIEFASPTSIERRGNTSECECDKFKPSGISIADSPFKEIFFSSSSKLGIPLKDFLM